VPIATPATQDTLATDPKFRRHIEGWPLLGRGGDARDVAYAALFIASDELHGSRASISPSTPYSKGAR